MTLDEAFRQLRDAAQHLATEHPDIAGDDEVWLSSMESLTDAASLAEHLAERAIYLVSLQAAALERAKALQARAQRFAASEERIRGILLALVDAAGGRKMVFSGLTLSPRNTPARVIANDPTLTPEDYMVEIVTRKPDTKAIRDALEIGAEVPGWYKNQGGRSLAILVR